jgi:deoxyribodipyrimidine photo-lyase
MLAYWFRNDLRLEQNEALAYAANLDEILPIYVLDERLLGLSYYGFKRCGAHRMQFILNTVAALRAALQAQGSDLIFRIGEPQQVISQLADSLDCSFVVCTKEVSQDDANLESSLSKRLKPENIEFDMIWDNTLYHAQDLPFLMHKMPEDFEAFAYQVKNCHIRPLNTGQTYRFAKVDIDPGSIPRLKDLGYEETFDGLMAGELAALASVHAYLEGKESKLSAYLAIGSISPRQVYFEIINKKINTEKSTDLVNNLRKRDFFKFLALKFGTRLFKEAGIKLDFARKGNRDRAKLAQWYQGNTENQEVNEIMKKLGKTGFLNQNDRKAIASYFVKDMAMAWTLGAAYFENAMVDYDVYTNWGNWNFTAEELITK